MAIDFLIFGFLLISFTINLLPLGAFWVTPGLRTTANRFVINLLIINLIGCCILAPTLYLSGNMLATVEISDDTTIADTPAAELNSLLATQKVKEVSKDDNGTGRNRSGQTREMTFQCNASYCEQLTIIGGGSGEKIVITELNEKKLNNMIHMRDSNNPRILIESSSVMRCWTIDLAAALGALSVLLVVGDTWMAVRDPLRYHSRISGVKSWVLIAMTWILGILFGVMSALREINFQCNMVMIEKKSFFKQISSSANSAIFSMIFACIYFIVIILLPFGFVCGMYWRIFSEAKENGLRMRQNGSSPLLQSATNLSHHEQQRNAHLNMQRRNSIISSTSGCGGGGGGGGGGLQLQIDRKRNHRESSSVKIAEVKKTTPPTLPPLAEPEESLTTTTEEYQGNTADIDISMNLPNDGSEEIKRNYSVRQFPHLGRQSSQDIIDSNRLNTFRQIKSTPNLQKHNTHHHQGDRNSLETTFQLRNSSPYHNPGTTNASPKSLSYMTSIRRRLSNASSLFKQREESRAARISILVVIMFLVSYLPYGLLVLLQDRWIDNFPYSTQLAVFMILLANVGSPFIFAYRNKHVRHGVTRIFGLDARSKEHRLQCNGLFLRYGTKARISVKRSSSKVSAYSMNSCKYLTPILKHTNRNLRNNKNNEEHKQNEVNTFLTSAQVENSVQHTVAAAPAAGAMEIENSNKLENIDVVDTTVSIQPVVPYHHEIFSIFKVFCKSSKIAKCATQPCIADSMEV